ncbi:hypothetical protein [Caulobacter segnis]|jgi:hypothetical protein|uniref:hypothetical protein n=1 Tax=Caulobacter segnis TaxID=88688 RepID=UPI001CBD0B4C|nr:hypothetical protein [Caulobacter segnis]UAL12309.1 hypothetical protein K8940_08525 [Caulobacter segnis]
MSSPVQRLSVAVLALCVGMGAADAALAGKQDKAKVPQTSAEANTDNLGSAVVAPLRDINVVRSQIPDLLKQAVADPYAPPKTGCEPLKAEIDTLDAVLGDDYDDPKDDNKGEGMGKPVLGVVASTITDVIPMRGWVRRLTGAERHDQQVRDAIKAGFVRRGYLKGLYNAGTCKGNRTVFVAAKPAPKPVFVAAQPAAPPAPVQVAAEPVPIPVNAPLAPFTTLRVAASDATGVP